MKLDHQELGFRLPPGYFLERRGEEVFLREEGGRGILAVVLYTRISLHRGELEEIARRHSGK